VLLLADTTSDVLLSAETGVSIRDQDDNHTATQFLLGFRPELVWRPEKGSIGAGGYAEAWTNFDDFVAGAGASMPTPSFVHPSAGAYVRSARGTGTQPGVTVGVLFGGWTLGHTGPSSVDVTGSLGLRVDGRFGLGSAHERALFFALQFDLRYLLVPFVFFM
jgi:hypothetical protein